MLIRFFLLNQPIINHTLVFEWAISRSMSSLLNARLSAPVSMTTGWLTCQLILASSSLGFSTYARHWLNCSPRHHHYHHYHHLPVAKLFMRFFFVLPLLRLHPPLLLNPFTSFHHHNLDADSSLYLSCLASNRHTITRHINQLFRFSHAFLSLPLLFLRPHRALPKSGLKRFTIT